MDKRIVARWQQWSGNGIEHLVVRQSSASIVADGAVLGGVKDEVFAARYRLLCDGSWIVKSAEVALFGDERIVELVSDGSGTWSDKLGKALPQLEGAIDIDLSITPFTNTLPIRRLRLAAGQSAQILAVYVQLPDFTVTTDGQRYTCLEPLRRYRYESIDTDFVREIEVDEDGLVVTYPGLFKRLT